MNEWKKATLVSSRFLSPKVKLLAFETGEDVMHIPGQYVTIRKDTKSKEIVAREYSIVSAPSPHSFELAVTKIALGELSPYLHNLMEGQSIFFKGPQGKHFLFEDSSDLFAIAAGTGIAPFISFIKHNPNPSGQITLLASFKTKADILFASEIDEVKQKVSVHITITREEVPGYLSRRIDAEMISQIVKQARVHKNFYVSGGSSFVNDVREYLLQIGVQNDKISLEYFG